MIQGVDDDSRTRMLREGNNKVYVYISIDDFLDRRKTKFRRLSNKLKTL